MSSLIQTNDKFFSHDHVFKRSDGGVPYLYNKGAGIIDGIGRQHVNLYAKCDQCGKEVCLARLHVDSNGKIYE